MTMILDGTSGITTNSGTVISASTIGVGGATPSAIGAGITFPATASASTDANTLDDYEEGTWTPTITPASGSLTAYTSYGKYTKTGDVVFLNWGFIVTTLGTASGAFTTTNAPFTSSNHNAQLQFTGLSRENQITGTFYNFSMAANTTNISNTSVTWGASYGWGMSLTYRSA